MSWFVYIVRCADDTLYTGTTTDIDARTVVHNSGQGAKYTAARRPVHVVYSEQLESRSAALKREHAIKQMARRDKETLIAGLPG